MTHRFSSTLFAVTFVTGWTIAALITGFGIVTTYAVETRLIVARDDALTIDAVAYVTSGTIAASWTGRRVVTGDALETTRWMCTARWYDNGGRLTAQLTFLDDASQFVDDVGLFAYDHVHLIDGDD